MGFQEPQFTWSGRPLCERLDRVLCNFDWEILAPATVVHHLHKLKFDHRMLAFYFGKDLIPKTPHPFDFLVGGCPILILVDWSLRIGTMWVTWKIL